MTKIMIRGGDMDLVEYDFSPFNVGEKINTCGLEEKINLKEKKIIAQKGEFTVRVPGRIHLCVLDMNRFSPVHAGGGGLGFAIQNYTTATVECIDSITEVDYSRVPIIRHFVEVFKKVTGYTGGFKIRISDHEQLHVGLGSTGCALVAVGHAMNRALGEPLTAEEIRFLVGYNYVEETVDGRIIGGFETGVGPAAVTYGGMTIMGDDLTLVYNETFAEGMDVYVLLPHVESKSSGNDEFSLLMNRARVLDYRDREQKAYFILMDLIPALKKQDIKTIGDIVWEIDFLGSKRAEVEHNSFEIYRYMNSLRDAGCEFVAMSSVGPSIAVVTSKPQDEVLTLVEKLGLELVVKTKTDNSGVVYL